mgnify:CR=1 FL=1
MVSRATVSIRMQADATNSGGHAAGAGVGPRSACLPAGAAVDHAVGLERLEAALEGLDLADFVVLLNVLLPQVGTVLLVVGSLVARRDVDRAEDLGLEAVLLLDGGEEGHRLVEEVEGIDHHDLALAGLQVVQAAEQVRDDAVSSDHGVREDSVVEVLARGLKREHGLRAVRCTRSLPCRATATGPHPTPNYLWHRPAPRGA